MFNTKEKKERSLGANLFLKAHRCNSPKCVHTRKGYRPGQHGQARHSVSDYGQLLNEKQKVRVSYGLRESSLARLFRTASKNPGNTANLFVQLLERRIDNAVFRMGLAPSRAVARQFISHGHIMLNGRKHTIPSYEVHVGDKLSVRPQSRNDAAFKELSESLKKYETPAWLRLDREKLEGEVVSLPKDQEVPFDVNLVIDYYSK
ncbi:MAG: 30S ribosomal protein S4 [Patescibacteria group bacterium]|nr:30S ribosomal protein S4 [Patescibacteria group bacterium]